MISNDLVQVALLTKINATTNLTSLISGSVDEYNFQGTDWLYPCGRLHIESQTDGQEDISGCPSFVEFSFYAFSEKGTSKEANQIAGAFVTAFKGLSFSQNNIKFCKIKILENIPAIRQDSRTWRAQVRCRSLIHNI